MKKTICFGEIMLRLTAPGFLRLRQALPGTLESSFAGAEANAAVAIASLGGAADFVTTLPDNEISEACLANLRAMKVGVENILLHQEGRFGVYFVESGASQRGGRVHYDRDGSTFMRTSSAMLNWSRIIQGADWFHSTGISAAVSRLAAETTGAALKAAKSHGLSVSLDINHRRKLWQWDESVAPDELARRTLATMMPDIDIVVGNTQDLALVSGLVLPATNGTRTAAVEAARQVASLTAQRHPHLRYIVVTLRENLSATHNNWGALLYAPAANVWATAPESAGTYAPYEITAMVDRVGTGDAFAGALIHALKTPDLATPATALRFAVAASCLAHATVGDFSYCTRADVEALLAGDTGGAMAR